MVELMGVEPTTSSMPRKRSPTELQPRSISTTLYYEKTLHATECRVSIDRISVSIASMLVGILRRSRGTAVRCETRKTRAFSCELSDAGIGGSVWESNPPENFISPHTGFEDQEGHQAPSTPAR